MEPLRSKGACNDRRSTAVAIIFERPGTTILADIDDMVDSGGKGFAESLRDCSGYVKPVIKKHHELFALTDATASFVYEVISQTCCRNIQHAASLVLCMIKR